MTSAIMEWIDLKVSAVLDKHATVPLFDQAKPHTFALMGARVVVEHVLRALHTVAGKLP